MPKRDDFPDAERAWAETVVVEKKKSCSRTVQPTVESSHVIYHEYEMPKVQRQVEQIKL